MNIVHHAFFPSVVHETSVTRVNITSPNEIDCGCCTWRLFLTAAAKKPRWCGWSPISRSLSPKYSCFFVPCLSLSLSSYLPSCGSGGVSFVLMAVTVRWQRRRSPRPLGESSAKTSAAARSSRTKTPLGGCRLTRLFSIFTRDFDRVSIVKITGQTIGRNRQ